MHRLIARTRNLLLFFVLLSPLASADVLNDVLERGTIRVGVSEFAPWTMRSANGELRGFEIDVARKIAADMGIEAEFKVYDWEDIIAAVQNGEIDVIAGGMAITPARALQVNFSRPLATSGIGIATNMRKTKNVESLTELDDKDVVISVVAETLAASVAETFFGNAEIKTYSTREPAERDVIEGRAHAYLATMPEVNFLALKNAAKVDVPMSEPLVASSEGLAIKKGEQALLNFLNAWVTAHHSDRWLESTHDYWFETMSWMSESDK